MMNYMLCYLVIANLFGLVIMFLDKGYAKKHHRRISEKNLLLTAVAGGSIGVLAGMYLVRHKTQKPKFYLGVPAILVVQLGLVYLLFAQEIAQFCQIFR